MPITLSNGRRYTVTLVQRMSGMTAEEFAAGRFDLPNGGRWCELEAGEVRSHEPPDDAHGTFVLNLSKALAGYLARLADQPPGAACFEIGLHIARDPDTVRCPPMSFFTGPGAFAEMDKTVTGTRPAWVVEIASSESRRRGIGDRVGQWLEWGVRLVWVVHPARRRINVHRPGEPLRTLTAAESIDAAPVLEGFAVCVGELFQPPEWWTGKRAR